MNEIDIMQLTLSDFFEFCLTGIIAGFLISFIFILVGLGVSGALKMFRQA